MKVLHLIGGGDFGGAKSHVLSLVQQLGKHIDVKLVSLRPGAFADDAKAMGIDVEVVHSGNIFKDIKNVAKIVRKGGYELIHSHGAKANMISVVVKRFVHIPTVTTVHSDYRLDYLQNIYKKYSFGMINTFSLRFIDYYISVSRNYKEMLVERNFNPERIFTLYNGIDVNAKIPTLTRAELSKKYNISLEDDDLVVGILARLDPVKGLNTFLDAAAEVLKQKSGVKFLICGKGDERKSLESRAEALGITGSVFFMGHVDPNDFLSNFDINLLTSISESFPYAILEGARLKKATVSSNVGGISDLIEDGVNGFLFHPGDYKKLAEHILKLAGSSELRQEMGEKLYNKAKAQFSLDTMCRTQMEIYSDILEKAREDRFYDVVISGYYGHENSGDDAILMAIINNLRSLKKNIKIIVMSKKPSETKRIYGVNSINRFNLIRTPQVMRNSKLFISGGGSLIQDITSTRSLMYYLSTIWLAKKVGLKVMVYANGIGPISRNMNRVIARNIVNNVDIITLRDESSLKELSSLHIDKPKVIVTADPVFALDYTGTSMSTLEKIFLLEGIDSPGPYIGFSVREWKGHEGYEAVIAEVADYMADKYKLKPVFIPMQYPKDLPITRTIVSMMKNKGYIVRNKYNVTQMLGIIKNMDMLVSIRLHALIYAASQGIPVVGIVYEPKVEGFLESIGQTSAGHLENLNFEDLKMIVDRVWNRRAEYKLQLSQATLDLKEKALQNAKIALELIKNESK